VKKTPDRQQTVKNNRPTVNKRTKRPAAVNSRTPAVFAALSGGPAAPIPHSDALDALDSGAIDALFAGIG
jgi:hypothetical protein